RAPSFLTTRKRLAPAAANARAAHKRLTDAAKERREIRRAEARHDDLQPVMHEAGLSPGLARTTYAALFAAIEWRVDLRDLLGFPGLVGLRVLTLLDSRRPAEVDVERADAVAAVGVDLLERRQQLLLRRRPHV